MSQSQAGSLLAAVALAVKARDAAFLKAWEKVKFDSMANFFRLIRRGFSPDLPIILCTVASEWHFAIERLQGDGTWKALSFVREPTGLFRLRDTVRAKNPTVYRWK